MVSGCEGVARCVANDVLEDLLQSRNIDTNRSKPNNTRSLVKPEYDDTK
jgi:hypothetical protein